MLISCGSLHGSRRAVQLGQAFARNFARNSANLAKGEIVLFRAMQKSLRELAQPQTIVIEEYHGVKHQVMFRGSGTYSRPAARCELSDLLVIVYDRNAKDARLTYIQAKSERDVTANISGVAGRGLKANLEQWDLLARRPLISAAPGAWGRPTTFNPPPDLLSNAVLESMCSFAFFLHGNQGVDIYYCAASLLAMPYAYSSPAGKLTAVGNVCRCGPVPECLSVYGNAEFGAFLFAMMIGEPILVSSASRPTATSGWLAAQLRGFAGGADGAGELASELADLLDPDRAPAAKAPDVGAATLMLIGLTHDGRLD